MSKPIIKIKNIRSTIEMIPRSVSEELYEHLSFEVPGAKYSNKTKNIDPKTGLPEWDGKIHLFDKRYNGFLTGLTFKVIEFLREKHGVTPIIKWMCDPPQKTLDLKWNGKDFPLRDYQTKIVKTCIQKKRAVIEATTGSGKTVIVSKIIQELGVSPFLFYVLTRDLMYQAKNMLEKSIPGLEVGIIGDGKCEIKDVNIITVQTAIAAYKKTIGKKDLEDIKESAEMDDIEYKELKKENLDHIKNKKAEIQKVIESAVGEYADEVHHWSAKICKEVMLKSPKAYYRYGGSATPIRSDNSYLTIEGLFGRKTAVITASDLIRLGYLIKPTIRFIKMKTKQHWADTWAQDREFHIVENSTRNNCIISLAKHLMSKNIRTMILVQTIKHGSFLEKQIPESVFIYGGSPGKKRTQALEDIQTGKIKVLISSVIADEGLDLPSLSALIIAGGGKSPTRAKQRVGRVIRKGSQFALVYDFLDVGRWSKEHSIRRKEILEQEEEFDVKIIPEDEILTQYMDLF